MTSLKSWRRWVKTFLVFNLSALSASRVINILFSFLPCMLVIAIFCDFEEIHPSVF